MEAFPPEIIFSIYDFLGLVDKLSFYCTNKYFYYNCGLALIHTPFKKLIDFRIKQTKKISKKIKEKRLSFVNDANFRDLIKQLNTRIQMVNIRNFYPSFIGLDKKKFNDKYILQIYPIINNYFSFNSVTEHSPDRVNIKISRLLGKLVLNKGIYHLNLYIRALYTDISVFITELEKFTCLGVPFFKKYDQYVKNILVCFYEPSYLTLLSYINQYTITLLHWKVIIFQILFTLASIHREYPSFKHNELTTVNIMCETTVKQINKYQFKDKIFLIKNPGIFIKITNFYSSSIDGFVENMFVNEEWTSINKTKNKYFDICGFLSILSQLDMNSKCRNMPNEIVNFIDRIVPKNYRLAYSSGWKYGLKSAPKIKINIDEYTTPAKILNDELFQDFRM